MRLLVPGLDLGPQLQVLQLVVHVARLVLQKMGEGLGQTFIVDNKGGANGIIGTEVVARARGARDIYLATFRDPPWNAPFYRKLGFHDVARADYLPWMSALEEGQAAFLDLSTRVFMKLGRG